MTLYINIFILIFFPKFISIPTLNPLLTNFPYPFKLINHHLIIFIFFCSVLTVVSLVFSYEYPCPADADDDDDDVVVVVGFSCDSPT